MLINRKFVLRFIIAYVALMVIIIGFVLYKNSQNPYGKYLSISNLGEYTSGKPNDNDRLNLIKHNLYKTVGFNVKTPPENNSIKDVLVRKGSFNQTLDKSYDIYTVSFIVDIKSLKQSYNVSYQWAKDSDNNKFVDEYGTQVTCVPLDKLKYGDFHCKDERIVEQGVENFDPVGLILPYHVKTKYKITGYTKYTDTTVLHVEAYAPRWVAKLDKQTLDTYTSEIKAWLSSRKLDPTHYTFDYIY